MKPLRMLALAGLPLMLAAPAAAQELKIGLASEPTSIDPHFHNLGPNNALRRHVFEGLVGQNAEQKVQPELASSWRALDETTWEFKLRPNVKFSNGAELTAKDVIYTFCRVPTVENSPSSFTFAVRGFTAVEAPDPHTVVIKTANPLPLVPNNLATIGILSAKANGGENVKFRAGGCEGLGTPPKSVDFNDPAKAIGTGPYRLANYTRGTSIILERNDSYWGRAPHWAKVTFRPMSSQGARVAGLLAGDVDFIENPPIQDFERIKGAGFQIAEGLSNRIIYLHLDQFQDPSWKTPGRQGHRQEPVPRQARARGGLEGDQPPGDRRPHHGRARGRGGRAPALSAVRRDEGFPGREIRSGGGKEALGRGRLPERLRGHARLAERPLHQRREDRPGDRADADPRRHQDQHRRDDRLDLLHAAQQVRVLDVSRRLGRRFRARCRTR